MSRWSADCCPVSSRGWALCQALIALPYYWETNPGIARQAQHALDLVLHDAEA